MRVLFFALMFAPVFAIATEFISREEINKVDTTDTSLHFESEIYEDNYYISNMSNCLIVDEKAYLTVDVQWDVWSRDLVYVDPSGLLNSKWYEIENSREIINTELSESVVVDPVQLLNAILIEDDYNFEIDSRGNSSNTKSVNYSKCEQVVEIIERLETESNGMIRLKSLIKQ